MTALVSCVVIYVSRCKTAYSSWVQRQISSMSCLE